MLEDALERAKNKLIQEIDEHEKTVKEKVKTGRQLASNANLDETLSQESEVLKADIESDLKAMKKIKEIPLVPMGVLAPGSAHARPSAQPPIDTSGTFSAHMSGGGEIV